jgi:hypothetical protein
MKSIFTVLLCTLILSALTFATPPTYHAPSRPTYHAPKGNTSHAGRLTPTERRLQARESNQSNGIYQSRQQRNNRREENRSIRKQSREQVKYDRSLAKIRQHADRRFEKGKRNAQKHWDGSRFDRRFFTHNFGVGHRFFFGAPGFYWYGNSCLFGSTFEFGGVYFALQTPCTLMWPGYPWMTQVYIDESIDGGYILVNPDYTEVFGLTVVF